MKRSLLIAFAALATFSCARPAFALPRYAARYHQSCNLCHANPSGGGMRTLYASQFLVPEEMAMSRLSDDVVKGISPEIADNITIGADLRTLYVYSDDNAHTLDFFEMQGDIYLNFQMTEKMSLYFDRGQSQSVELYGLAYVLPCNGYVKVGRFTPAFGWKRADHTAFTRSMLGFSPPANTDSGVEVNTRPGTFDLTLSAVNGAAGSLYDTDNKVAFLGRAEQRFGAAGMRGAVGISARYNPVGAGDERVAGGFGYLGIDRLIWLGEVDWQEFEPAGAAAVTGFIQSHEVSYEATQGLYVLGTYDFYDPDIDLESGYESRYGGGVSALVNPFLDVEVLVRQYDVHAGPDMTGSDYLESVVQVHFLY